MRAFTAAVTVQKDCLPSLFVECFVNLGDQALLRSVKLKYKKVAVIYLWMLRRSMSNGGSQIGSHLWHNQITGRMYVGRTVNLRRRLENYLAATYDAAKQHV